MKTRQVNLRLEPALVRSLQEAADAELLDRGTMMRKLLLEALQEWRLKHALRRYQAGEISIGRACEDTGQSHWEMIDLIHAHGIAYRFNAEEALERIRPLLKKRRERVAEGGLAYDADPQADASPPPAGRRRSLGGRAPRPRKRSARGGADDTLPEFRPGPGGVLLVGINPAPASVNRGHYYQGKLGHRLWKRLESVDLLSGAVPGQEDDSLVAAGHGLTDLVKRVTASAAELSPDELRAGGKALQEKVREWRPGLVVFAFKMAAVHALANRDVSAGLCGEIAGAKAFLLPGPYAAKADADRIYAELRKLVAKLKLASEPPTD